jgi:stress-induced morphogen
MTALFHSAGQRAKGTPHMTPNELKKRIESLAPGTTAEVTDLTGTQDHYQAVIVSPAFEGKMMIDQHRMIYQLFQAEMDSGEVHALTLKTYTSK